MSSLYKIITKFKNNNIEISKKCDISSIINLENDFKALCCELKNGDVVINLYYNKFCYFNIKNFSIQTIYDEIFDKYYEYYNKNDKIAFKQFDDINSFNFIYYNRRLNYKININNGKITKDKFSFEPYLEFDKYYISQGIESDKFQILDRFNLNKTLFRGYFYDSHISDIILINEKKKIFALLDSYNSYCKRGRVVLNVKIYQILD